MKRQIIFISVFLVAISFIFAVGWGEGEIYIGTLGLNGDDEVNYRMEAKGTVWEGDPYDFSIDTDGSHTIAYAPKTPSSTVGNTDFSSYNWSGYRINRTDTYFDTFGCGLYKFYVNQNNAYFYIDYRDSNYTTEYSNCGGHCADTWIKYDADNDDFAYISDPSDAHDPDDDDWIDITNGDILYIWDIKEQSAPNTKGFPSFWSKCLYILDDYNNPRLTWGAHPTFSTTNFKIYRASSSTPVSKPITLNYSLIGTVSSSTYEFIDNDINFGQVDYIYYYIKAYNSTSQTYSGLSNIADIRGGFYKSNFSNHVSNNTTSGLYLNHPNPFNPSTNITYSIRERSNVNLRIYNSLGQEISMLVNEIKSEGNYSVRSDASNLPSGVYFYKLETDYFTDVKKMIVTK